MVSILFSSVTTDTPLQIRLQLHTNFFANYFHIRFLELLPENKRDEKEAEIKMNISNWRRGTYHLNKEPCGFLDTDIVIGIGSGTHIDIGK